MGRKFTNFALFYSVFEDKFQVQAPQGAYIRRGDFTEGFLRYHFGGLTFGGAHTWRGLLSEFYSTLTLIEWNFKVIITSCLWTVSRLVNRKHYYLNLFFNFPWNVNYLILPCPRKNFTNYSWRKKSQQISRSPGHCWYFLKSGHSVSVTSSRYV